MINKSSKKRKEFFDFIGSFSIYIIKKVILFHMSLAKYISLDKIRIALLKMRDR